MTIYRWASACLFSMTCAATAAEFKTIEADLLASNRLFCMTGYDHKPIGVAWESVKSSRYQPQSDGDRIFSDTVSRRFLEEENKTAFYNGAKYRVLGKPASACYDYSAARIQRMAGYLKV
ncbi:TPA: hypothetical protein ACHV5J_000651 [Klebsiella quasipneumoniae]|uniref:hypothetical protein n=1 Tax=Klebsiella quasipneumoniae TaxID=1463165 RepID=UPI0027E84867|nr:hypothetical protein [Klebsiella quasipneumoniae subsp. quasipneumoniae]